MKVRRGDESATASTRRRLASRDAMIAPAPAAASRRTFGARELRRRDPCVHFNTVSRKFLHSPAYRMSDPVRYTVTPRYSEAVVFNDVVYLSGQVPDTPEGSSIAWQVASVLAQIDANLALAGSNKSRILSATVYLKSIEAGYNALNEAWEKWLPHGCAPARTTIGGVTLAKAEWDIEITVTAAVGGR